MLVRIPLLLIVVPNAGHWLMEEQPAATMHALITFLEGN
jgi:pimeloyl-ACP methyl ester carboxylesterase